MTSSGMMKQLDFLTPEEDIFVKGHKYRVRVNLTCSSGYAFTDPTTGTINGNPAVFYSKRQNDIDFAETALLSTNSP